LKPLPPILKTTKAGMFFSGIPTLGALLRTSPSPLIRPVRRVAVGVMALLLALSHGGEALAEAPQSLSLLPKSDKSMATTMATQGVLKVEIPGKGAIYVAPRTVDSSSGKWGVTVETSQMAPDEGNEVEGSTDCQWKTEGATAAITLKASTDGKEVRVLLKWTLQGDASGHIRADLLIPYEIADNLRMTSTGGKVIFEKGAAKGGVFPNPVSFIDTNTDQSLFTLVSDNANVGIRVDKNYEQCGIEVRISNYPPGGKNTLSQSQSLEFSLEFP